MTLSGISYSGQVKFLQVQITFRDFLLRTSEIFTSPNIFRVFLLRTKPALYTKVKICVCIIRDQTRVLGDRAICFKCLVDDTF